MMKTFEEDDFQSSPDGHFASLLISILEEVSLSISGPPAVPSLVPDPVHAKLLHQLPTLLSAAPDFPRSWDAQKKIPYFILILIRRLKEKTPLPPHQTSCFCLLNLPARGFCWERDMMGEKAMGLGRGGGGGRGGEGGVVYLMQPPRSFSPIRWQRFRPGWNGN